MHPNSSTQDVSSGTVPVARSLEEVEALLVACSESVRAMAWRFARGSYGRVDPDELYSLAMVEMCEAVAAGRLARARNPLAYLKQVARYAMVEEWRRVSGQSTVSLDAPLSGSENDSLTLQDVLAATPVVAVAPAAATKRERVVRQALERLTPRRRAALQRLYGLAGYGAHTTKEAGAALQVTSRAVYQAKWLGLADLARDPGLRAVIGIDGVGSGENEEDVQGSVEADHTPACPYCGDLACWCHTDVAYHQVVTMVPVALDDRQLQVLYACFGLAEAVEVAR